jgi:hypothetical protein
MGADYPTGGSQERRKQERQGAGIYHLQSEPEAQGEAREMISDSRVRRSQAECTILDCIWMALRNTIHCTMFKKIGRSERLGSVRDRAVRLMCV